MRALVTGGAGFLAGSLARRLRERRDDVRVFGRASYPELEALGIDTVRGDLTDYEEVLAACDDRDVVFHAGAKVGFWGRPEDFEAVNVQGTKNVLRACLSAGVGKLVFTGSPSVVFDGRDIEGGTECAPYAEHFDCDYSRTKALAEKMVLAADHDRLCTVSLRPHLVWGPGDRQFLPRLAACARAGRLFRIGDENKPVDTLYIDDAVEAHILAAIQLSPLSEIGGKAYFLSSGQPRPIWEIVNRLLAVSGLGPVNRCVPRGLAFAAAGACEGVWRTLRLSSEPPLTRCLVNQLTTARWFDITAAKRELGWRPQVGFEDGLDRLAQWIRATRSAL